MSTVKPQATYREIAEHIRVTTGVKLSFQRIRQIEIYALKKLQRALEGEQWVKDELEGTVSVPPRKI